MTCEPAKRGRPAGFRAAGRTTLAVLSLAAVTLQVSVGADDVTLGVPGRVSGTPWVAADGAFVAVVWGATADGKTDVFSAVSRNGGSAFSAPVRVNVVPGEARLGGELPPRVSLRRVDPARDPEIAVLWTARDGGTTVKLARSSDGGQTFRTPVTLSSTGSGFVAVWTGGKPGDTAVRVRAFTLP